MTRTTLERTISGTAFAGLLAAALMANIEAAGATCESLASLKLQNARIASAQVVPAGKFTLPNARGQAAQEFSTLPAFCRVAVSLTPSADSDIKVEVWLPASGWNDKYE